MNITRISNITSYMEKQMRRIIASGLGSAGIACLILGILAGCGSFGESHNYNAPPPVGNIQAQWVRIESPGNYHTIIRACVGGDGIYLTQADNNSVTVVPGDLACSAGQTKPFVQP